MRVRDSRSGCAASFECLEGCKYRIASKKASSPETDDRKELLRGKIPNGPWTDIEHNRNFTLVHQHWGVQPQTLANERFSRRSQQWLRIRFARIIGTLEVCVMRICHGIHS